MVQVLTPNTKLPQDFYWLVKTFNEVELPDELPFAVSDGLYSTAILEAIRGRQPSSNRPEFEHEPVAAVIEWLADPDKGWLALLKHFPQLSLGFSIVLRRLAVLEVLEPEQISDTSLTARRLICLHAIGVDIFTPFELVNVIRRTFLLPGAQSAVTFDQTAGTPSIEQVRVRRPTSEQFLRKADLFFSDVRFGALDAEAMKDAYNLAIEREQDAFLSEGGLGIASLVPSGKKPLPSSKIKRIYLAQAAVTSAMAIDSRPLLGAASVLFQSIETRKIGVTTAKIAEEEGGNLIGKWERIPNQAALAALVYTSILTGTPIRQLSGAFFRKPLKLPENELQAELFFKENADFERQRSTGDYWYRAEERCPAGGYLIKRLNQPSGSIYLHRLPPQQIALPLPFFVWRLIAACDFTRENAQNFVKGDILTKADSFIKSHMMAGQFGHFSESTATFAKAHISRLHLSFFNVAQHFLDVPPAIISLIRGEPFGFARASMNYASINTRLLQQTVISIQAKFLGLVGKIGLAPHPVSGGFDAVGAGIGGWHQPISRRKPTIVPVRDLAKSCQVRAASLDRANYAALADLNLRLIGARYQAKPLFEKILSSELSAIKLADKNLSGVRHTRLIPLTAQLAKEASVFLSAAQPLFQQSTPDELQKCRSFGNQWESDPSLGRKAIYSHSLSIPFGEEMRSAMFGHGPNIIKALGVNSPYPLRWFQQHASQRINELLKTTGIATAWSALANAAIPSPQGLQTADNEEPTPELSENIDISGIPAHLPIPSDQVLRDFRQIRQKLPQFLERKFSRPELEDLLLLLLGIHLVPLRYAIKFRKYFLKSSFVEAEGKSFFLAPIKQSDDGLGILPLPISLEVRAQIEQVLSQLTSKSGRLISSHRATPNLSVLAELTAHYTLPFPKRFKQIAKASDFHCRMSLGGALFHAFAGRVLNPPNYYSIEDLILVTTGSSSINTWEGKSWSAPYQPTALQRRESKAYSKYKKLASARKLPPGSPYPYENMASWSSFEAYIDFAETALASVGQSGVHEALKFHRAVLPGYRLGGKCNLGYGTALKLSASEIIKTRFERGNLKLGKPLRLLPVEWTSRFLEHCRQLANTHWDEPTLRFIETMLLTGCRPSEISYLKLGHFHKCGQATFIEIRGRKTKAAKRLLDISFFSDFDQVCHTLSELVSRAVQLNTRHPISADRPWIKAHPSFLALKNNAALMASKAFQRTLNEFGQEKPHANEFTLNCLRHATAIRLIQSAINKSFWNGNFWAQACQISDMLGHQSFSTTFAQYIGTAWATIKWPSPEKADQAYSVLRGETEDR